MFGIDVNGNTVSKVECMCCFKEWIAVHPSNCEDLECPYCKSDNTFRFVTEVPPPLPCGIL